MCAGIAALERGASVVMYEKAEKILAGGNTKYTAGAMRFCFDGLDSLRDLLKDPEDERLEITDFGSYTKSKFAADLQNFNNGRALSEEQEYLILQSHDAMSWLSSHGVKFEPIYSRQSYKKDGRFIFWGGLAVAAANEGVGLFEQQLAAYTKLGGRIKYNHCVTGLTKSGDKIDGVLVNGDKHEADAVIIASGGFEANEEMRVEFIGDKWKGAKVRGTPNNTGDGIRMALENGAMKHGLYGECHATPWTCTCLIMEVCTYRQ